MKPRKFYIGPFYLNLYKTYYLNLLDETLQTAVMHIGSNDITRTNYKTVNIQDLPQGVIDIGLKCKSYR